MVYLDQKVQEVLLEKQDCLEYQGRMEHLDLLVKEDLLENMVLLDPL